jgi:hypothetical protein
VERAAARRAVEESCPRCSARREPAQGYCVECGLPLPVMVGAVPSLRRRWLRRVGWYPGDWILVSLPTLALAAAGAAVSIAVTHHGRAGRGTTLVASTPLAPGKSVTPAPAVVSTSAATAPATDVRNGETPWPPIGSGWTVVLGSYPQNGGRTAPVAAATRAARAGLPEVGVLDSSGFSSLHPGYYVVFSGIYTAPADADTALRTAHANGFGSAYSRQISR